MRHSPFSIIKNTLVTNKWDEELPNPNQLRWKPFDLPNDDANVDFVEVHTEKYLLIMFYAFTNIYIYKYI